MQIYIHRNNQQVGPFTEAEIKAQLAAGTISPQDHVWWQGQQDWVPLSQSILATLTSGVPPVPAAPPIPASAKGKTSGLAIASLICSLAGLFCGLLSIAGIVCGHMSRSEIKKNPSLQGSGLALSGLILGYVWLPIYILIFSISFLIALGNQVKGTFKTTTTQIEQSTNSADQSATNSDQTTNTPDQNTPAPATNSPDQSTNSAPATNAPDQSTNSANSSTNASDSPTNAAPMTQ